MNNHFGCIKSRGRKFSAPTNHPLSFSPKRYYPDLSALPTGQAGDRQIQVIILWQNKGNHSTDDIKGFGFPVAEYHLPKPDDISPGTEVFAPLPEADSPDGEDHFPHGEANSPHPEDNSPHGEPNSPSGEDNSPE